MRIKIKYWFLKMVNIDINQLDGNIIKSTDKAIFFELSDDCYHYIYSNNCLKTITVYSNYGSTYFYKIDKVGLWIPKKLYIKEVDK